MSSVSGATRDFALSRRGALVEIAGLAGAGFGFLARQAYASGEISASRQPLHQFSAEIDSSCASDASSAADSTVESNKAKRFTDIPKDALISIEDLHDLVEDGSLADGKVKIVDIRSHRDYQKVQIEGSRNIPAGRQIEIRIDEIPQDKPVILIAYKNSDRLAETWFTLIDHGYDPDLVKVADGGVYAWAQANYPTLKNQFLGC